jgi:hypothetical protein
MAVLEHFRTFSEERFFALYQALTENGFGPIDGEVAKLLKFRPHAIRKLPLEKRAKLARQWIEQKKNAELCYELFGTYLMRGKRELVTGFLEATGVKHDNGLIEDVDHNTPAPDKIAAAVAELDKKFTPDDVTLYLAMCAEQWAAVPGLVELWKKRSGVA